MLPIFVSCKSPRIFLLQVVPHAWQSTDKPDIHLQVDAWRGMTRFAADFILPTNVTETLRIHSYRQTW